MPRTLAIGLALSFAAGAAATRPTRPTIVLVHGAFAESSSWDGVIDSLLRQGFRVVTAANPLRGVKRDAQDLQALLQSIKGSVVRVGHSYRRMLISAPAFRADKVRALVYVAAFLPEEGETALGLSGKFPGSSLGAALAPPCLAV
jgi:pimeloyl-ACP methyl ester carboxylesterase